MSIADMIAFGIVELFVLVIFAWCLYPGIKAIKDRDGMKIVIPYFLIALFWLMAGSLIVITSMFGARSSSTTIANAYTVQHNIQAIMSLVP